MLSERAFQGEHAVTWEPPASARKVWSGGMDKPENAAPASAPQRIVLVDPSDFTTPYDLALASAIGAQGHHVRLVGQAGDLARREPLHHGHFYPILASSWGRRLPAGTVRLFKGAYHGVDMLRLFRWLATFDARIVHFQWSPLPPIDRWAVRLLRRRLPVVLTMHDSIPYQGEASWLMRQGHAGLLQSFDAIIVHTHQAQHRVAAMGIDPSLVYQIPHGLLGNSGDSKAPLLRPPPKERLVLLQFGKVKPYKGVDLLLEALTLIPGDLRRRLDVRIVGKPYMDTTGFEQFVHARGLGDCVTLRFEFVSEAEEERLFAEADAILLPYREIDASGVAMSAIARGVPVLATAIGGFEELFEGEGGARLVPPADAAALSKAITDWISAPEKLKAAAEAMRLRRTRIPSWKEIAGLHLAVYAEAHARWMIGRKQDDGSLLF
jgi:glycosyltransferase involved in cell wall biosynthesis